ncbi:MAG: hypothetical protein ACHREM_03430 [Polyangiales bacterium]
MATSTIKARGDAGTIVDALAATCERVRRLYSESRSGMSLARFDIGVEVRKVMENEARYGKYAVRRIASAIGRGEDDLYRYALLPAAWSREGFVSLAARPSKKGVPLTLSHFVAIAKQPERLRDRLVRFALEGGVSVRELERESRRLAGAATTQERQPRAPRVALRLGLKAMSRRLSELEAIAQLLADGGDIAAALAALREAQKVVEATLAAAELRN